LPYHPSRGIIGDARGGIFKRTCAIRIGRDRAGRAISRVIGEPGPSGASSAAAAAKVGPGPFSKGSIPAGPSAKPTAAQQRKINALGQKNGCHTCGTKQPGTKTGNFVGDHQPPTKMNPPGSQQRYHPQCKGRSDVQGGRLRYMPAPSPPRPVKPWWKFW